MTTYELIKSAHGAVGILALATFWTAGFARKGSAVHVASGKIYLLTMAVILATAAPMVGMIIARGNAAGPFLAYLIVITGTACWTAWRAIRDKRDHRAYTGPVYRTLAVLNLASGAGILALGLARGSVIYAAFALIGVLGGADMLRTVRRQPTDARWWLREHYRGMIGNGIATHVAFLAIGLPRLMPQLAGPTLQMLAWLGPLAIAVVVRILLERKYRTAPQRAGRDAVVAVRPLRT
jgi:hypothetical protein